jgi:tetratricopeptide (TPR) repeat protein
MSLGEGVIKAWRVLILLGGPPVIFNHKGMDPPEAHRRDPPLSARDIGIAARSVCVLLLSLAAHIAAPLLVEEYDLFKTKCTRELSQKMRENSRVSAEMWAKSLQVPFHHGKIVTSTYCWVNESPERWRGNQEMLQVQIAGPVDEAGFGRLILTWRGPVKRTRVLANLPGWSKDVFYRLEKGEIAPAFDQLRPLYRALWLAGATIPPDGSQVFVKFARAKIESKRTHFDRRSDEAWAELLDDLLLIDYEFRAREHPSSLTSPNPLLVDTSHLVRRDDWHEQMKQCLDGPERAKVIVIPGPSGIGKTSELARFAAQLRRANMRRPILCDFRETSRVPGPEEALEIFMGSMLSALGYAQPQVPSASLEERVAVLLEQAEKSLVPVILIADHAECMLNEEGKLANCWERFLLRILKYQHRATLVLCTRQWPTWFAGELRFLAEVPVPPLSVEHSVLLLQQLGLQSVPQPLLMEISEKVGRVPICLEWVAVLAKQPILPGEEEHSASVLQDPAGTAPAHALTSSVRRLLAEPYIFGGTLAEEIAPLLEQLLANYHLSLEAQELLQAVSLATVPLARPALDVLAPQWTRIIRELRRASLLVSYADRVQALPSVAAVVVRNLSPEARMRREGALISAYQAWLGEGSFAAQYENEKGAVITELAVLLLSHVQLLPAAQLLVRYGWLSFNMGHAVRLARLAQDILEQWERQPDERRQNQEDECGKWLLQYLLSPYLGQKINRAARAADYQCMLECVIAKTIEVEPQTELFIIRHLMFYAMEQKSYADAQALVVACEQRLAPLIEGDPDLLASLLEKQGYLYTNWCEHVEELGDAQLAQTLRERAIAVYRQSNLVLTEAEAHTTPLKSSILKKRLAKSLTNLGYHLNRIGQHEEAIAVLQQSIELKEAGFSDLGSLSASYGELSQALAEQGRFDEALHYDQLALDHMQRLADNRDTVSGETVWIYRVNRGRLYVKVGRLTEARRLLEEAIEKIPERWEMYRMFARQALDEIKLREGGQVSPSQCDARWVERYRELVAFDSFAWLAPTHFTAAEQEEWEGLLSQREDPRIKKRMETLLAEGKQRELLSAIADQREPQFSYPAIPLSEVRDRIRHLLDLAEEIGQREANEVVRRFYIGDPDGEAKGAIPYQVDFLRAIEATALSDSASFWEHICAISPPPTDQEMCFALSRVKWFIQRGRELEYAREVSERVAQFVEQRLSLVVGDLPESQEIRAVPMIDTSLYGKPTASLVKREFPPETVKNLFNALFREQGCLGWEAVIDYAARNTRIEPGLRHYILAGLPYDIGKLTEQVAHEWGGHVAPRVAGEQSALGILGLGTGRSLVTEEGLGLFYELELARRTGQRFDEAKIYLGTLSTGLASGILVPPQTFLSLYTFLADFLLLYRLVYLGNEEMETAQAKARSVAQTRCLRTYRAVPDLSRLGICYPKDAAYERGLFQVYDAVAQDPAVLDWLAAGVVALEQIDDLKALGIPPAAHSSRALLEHPDLEAYIVSFAERAPSPS